jgi:hypothetical protein
MMDKQMPDEKPVLGRWNYQLYVEEQFNKFAVTTQSER